MWCAFVFSVVSTLASRRQVERLSFLQKGHGSLSVSRIHCLMKVNKKGGTKWSDTAESNEHITSRRSILIGFCTRDRGQPADDLVYTSDRVISKVISMTSSSVRKREILHIQNLDRFSVIFHFLPCITFFFPLNWTIVYKTVLSCRRAKMNIDVVFTSFSTWLLLTDSSWQDLYNVFVANF